MASFQQLSFLHFSFLNLFLIITFLVFSTKAHPAPAPIPLSRTISDYLEDGGHQFLKKTLSLSNATYYNPYHFFTREHAYVRDGDKVIRQSSSDEASDLEILRQMGLHIPGIDPESNILRITERQTANQCRNGQQPPVLIIGKKSQISITYTFETPSEVRIPVEFSIRKWADEFESNIRLRICFAWGPIDGKTLGATTTPYFTKGRGRTGGHKNLKLDVLYNPSLASALEDEDMIPGDRYHIHMLLNRAIRWHFDTSRRAPSKKYDLATTVLHELTHGLFFSGTVNIRNITEASYTNKLPGRFDQFMKVGENIGVVRSCRRGEDLFNAITSNNLRFTDRRSGTDFALFAPRSFEAGSSMYHFNSTASLEANCDSLGIDRDDCSDLMTHELVYEYTRRTLGETTLRVYRTMRSASVGPAKGEECSVPLFPNRQAPGRGISPQGGDDVGPQFVMPGWGIITVAVIGGIGVLMVFGVVINAMVGRR